MESKSIVYVALVAGLLLGAGAGYLIPQSSINNLSDEVESLTETVIVKEALIEESLTLIETISSDIESYKSQIEDLISQKNKFGKKNFNYKEKWSRNYKRFEALTSLDLHIEEIKVSKNYNSDEVKVNSLDCENILNSTKLLIKYAEELIREI